jgi:hypothetical protein
MPNRSNQYYVIQLVLNASPGSKDLCGIGRNGPNREKIGEPESNLFDPRSSHACGSGGRVANERCL